MGNDVVFVQIGIAALILTASLWPHLSWLWDNKNIAEGRAMVHYRLSLMVLLSPVVFSLLGRWLYNISAFAFYVLFGLFATMVVGIHVSVIWLRKRQSR